jgi:hypothetical protein
MDWRAPRRPRTRRRPVRVKWLTARRRTPKVPVLDAVREAKGEQSAQLIDHPKKTDIAKEAEWLLEGACWVPEPLRLIRAARRHSGDVIHLF